MIYLFGKKVLMLLLKQLPTNIFFVFLLEELYAKGRHALIVVHKNCNFFEIIFHYKNCLHHVF